MADMVQQILGMRGQVVGDVDQAQAGVARVIGGRHLGAQLSQYQFRGHAPFGMGGVAVGKQFHVSWDRGAERPDFRAGLDLLLDLAEVPRDFVAEVVDVEGV